jgi:putative transposase
MYQFNRQRKSIRLKEYDYSQPDEYFVTICTYNHECLLGEIVNEEMRLSQMGIIAQQCLMEIPSHFPNVELDEFIVMPNHIHGIIVITERRDLINQIPTTKDNFPLMKNPKQTLGKIIRNYKARVTKTVHDAGLLNFRWQSKYYDHIIRNEKELQNVREYILNNPIKWFFDDENPAK